MSGSSAAAFVSKDPADREAYLQRWKRILSDEAILKKTILIGGQVVGHIAAFRRGDEDEVTYWIARERWGQGIATRALAKFLPMVKARPLYGRAAADNLASIRVLEKCGFKHVGRERRFAEAVLQLDK